MTTIFCSEVAKKFRNKTAVRNISCSIEGEKIIGLIGRNGAGKSTFLRLLTGHLKPSSGTIEILNDAPFNNLNVSTNLIFIEDTMTFPPVFSLGEILKMGNDFYPNWQDELAHRLLDYANISRNAYHQNLSNGQRSTFNLIYGLATRCAITLLDEPMNGMDEAIRTDMYRAILKEYIAYPRTIMISSHHLQEIEHLLEEILLIDNGEVKLHAPLEDVKQMMVRLEGDAHSVKQLTNNVEVFFEKEDAIIYEAVVDSKSINENTANNLNVHMQPVNASDVCKYLTSKTTGGIDDVFKQ